MLREFKELNINKELDHCRRLFKQHNIKLQAKREFYWENIPIKKYYRLLKIFKQTKVKNPLRYIDKNKMVLKHDTGTYTLYIGD